MTFKCVSCVRRRVEIPSAYITFIARTTMGKYTYEKSLCYTRRVHGQQSQRFALSSTAGLSAKACPLEWLVEGRTKSGGEQQEQGTCSLRSEFSPCSSCTRERNTKAVRLCFPCSSKSVSGPFGLLFTF